MESGPTIKLGGLDVDFPYKPYGIQRAMMARIIVAFTNRQNCLIESPTGTGKSLSLLCSVLAWQQRSKLDKSPFVSAAFNQKQVEMKLDRLMSKPCTCGQRPEARSELDELNSLKKDHDCCKDKQDQIGDKNFIEIDVDSDDIEIIEEKPAIKKAKLGSQTEDGKCSNCRAIEAEKGFVAVLGPSALSRQAMKKIRIYYGTRTHKQIAQIVRELKKTNYKKDLKMNILSSRDRTCINENVKDLTNRNDKCQELIKNKGKVSNGSRGKSSTLETCAFYRDNNQMGAEFAAIYNEQETFDIEDAVEWGKKAGLCPYFGMRALQEEADITFCPYNYILDPNIRSAMNINLKNSIIILDEAHNIEDICRDSASFVITTQQIDEILTSLIRASSNYQQGSQVREAYDFFKNLFTDLKAFMIRFDFGSSNFAKDGDCLARKVFTQDAMISQLAQVNFGPDHYSRIRESLKVLLGDDEEGSEKPNTKDDQESAALNNNDRQIITQLTNTLEFIYLNDRRNSVDYRCIVAKMLNQGNRQFGSRNNSETQTSNAEPHIFQFSLVCLNPAIAFQKIHENCWSVVVASGTLSPIESLKTELGCNFTQVFEGSHVISDDRIFAAILSEGPNGIDLNCSYANSLRLDFQDELGQVVRDVCKTVPNGVLIFFPSYDRMENLYQRWFTKGYINEINETGKKIHREQKKFSVTQFDNELEKYHKAASRKGAVMMAVYRGKISEGIDFSDSAARAVISIGIPFPNVKEVTINLKKEYNDQARRRRPELMSGHQWYQTQAMRALNQSLGRVIRHKDDWGAIIMLDSRLKSSQNISGISKWVRRCTNTPKDYDIFRASLEDFVSLRQGNELK